MRLSNDVAWMSGIRLYFDAQTTHDPFDVIGRIAILMAPHLLQEQPRGQHDVDDVGNSFFARPVALEFARLGCNVALLARGIERLESAARQAQAFGVEALAIPVDVAAQARELCSQCSRELRNHRRGLRNHPCNGRLNPSWRSQSRLASSNGSSRGA